MSEEQLNNRLTLWTSKFQTRRARLIRMRTCSSLCKTTKNSYGIFSKVWIQSGVKSKRHSMILQRVKSREIGLQQRNATLIYLVMKTNSCQSFRRPRTLDRHPKQDLNQMRQLHLSVEVKEASSKGPKTLQMKTGPSNSKIYSMLILSMYLNSIMINQ